MAMTRSYFLMIGIPILIRRHICTEIAHRYPSTSKGVCHQPTESGLYKAILVYIKTVALSRCWIAFAVPTLIHTCTPFLFLDFCPTPQSPTSQPPHTPSHTPPRSASTTFKQIVQKNKSQIVIHCL